MLKLVLQGRVAELPSVRAGWWEKLLRNEIKKPADTETSLYGNIEVLCETAIYTLCTMLCIISMLILIRSDILGLFNIPFQR